MSSVCDLAVGRGTRAGRRVQQRRSLAAPQPTARAAKPSARPPGDRSVEFGCLNIRSLHNKVDDVLELLRDRPDSDRRHVDVICLTETWHDPDSVCIRRFRSLGYRVVERASPRPLEAVDSLVDVNHGGVAVIANPRDRLSTVNIDVRPTTFEFVVARAVVDRFACSRYLSAGFGRRSVDFFRRACRSA